MLNSVIIIALLCIQQVPRFEKEKGRGREEEEEEEGEGEEEEQKGMFSCMESSVFWIPRVLVWRLVAPCSRVLWKRSPKP